MGYQYAAHSAARAARAPGAAGSPAAATRLQWVVGNGAFEGGPGCGLDTGDLAGIDGLGSDRVGRRAAAHPTLRPAWANSKSPGAAAKPRRAWFGVRNPCLSISQRSL